MRRLAIVLVPLLTLSFVIGAIGCESEEDKAPTPEATISEAPIPAHFSTYTSEDLFSISYPPDWTPAAVIFVDTRILFVGGIPTEEGYNPNVNVMVGPRSEGYWTLDEIVEAEDADGRMNRPGYQRFSQLRATVDGREAAIIDWTDDRPGSGKSRYIQMFMVKDKFVWLVTCGVEFDDFEVYEGTFNDVVRSFRILQ